MACTFSLRYVLVLYTIVIPCYKFETYDTQVCVQNGTFDPSKPDLMYTGHGSFMELIKLSHIFVDKSLFIHEIITNPNKIKLIVAPRRWGKTVNLDMLRCFLEMPVDPEGKKKRVNSNEAYKYFKKGETVEKKRKKTLQHPPLISIDKQFVADHLGKHVVIYIDFNKLQSDNRSESAIDKFRSIISDIFKKYNYLTKLWERSNKNDASNNSITESNIQNFDQISNKSQEIFTTTQNATTTRKLQKFDKISNKSQDTSTSTQNSTTKSKVQKFKKTQDKEVPKKSNFTATHNWTDDDKVQKFEQILNKTSDEDTLISSIFFLCESLEKYFDKKVVILIDEYDKITDLMYFNPKMEITRKMHQIISSFMTVTFKTNPHMLTAVLSGKWKITDVIGLQDINTKEYNIIDTHDTFPFYGITRNELNQIIDLVGLTDRKKEVFGYYDGYKSLAHHTTMNPWSIAHCMNNKTLTNAWIESGSSKFILKLMKYYPIRIALEAMINDHTWSTQYSKMPRFSMVELRILSSFLQGNLDRFEITYTDLGLSFLCLAGYLTASDAQIKNSIQIQIPNQELKRDITCRISDFYSMILSRCDSQVEKTSENLLKYITNTENRTEFETSIRQVLDCLGPFKSLREIFQNYTREHEYNNREALHDVIFAILLKSCANGFTTLSGEFHHEAIKKNRIIVRKRMDFLMHDKETAIVIELKYSDQRKLPVTSLISASLYDDYSESFKEKCSKFKTIKYIVLQIFQNGYVKVNGTTKGQNEIVQFLADKESRNQFFSFTSQELQCVEQTDK